jgi:hypothetical protein
MRPGGISEVADRVDRVLDLSPRVARVRCARRRVDEPLRCGTYTVEGRNELATERDERRPHRVHVEVAERVVPHDDTHFEIFGCVG